ncbi:MAG: cyclase family protein [Mariniblastus sp.]
MKLIDLTLTLDPTMPGVDWETARTVEKDGWNAITLELYSHCGTHMDAPLHFGCGDQATIDQTPLETCLTHARIAQLPNTQPSDLITIADLGAIADNFVRGQSLLLNTGWSKHVGDEEIYRNQLPRVSEELAQWCVDSGIAVLGVEPPSVANVLDMEEVTRIHHVLLGGGVTIVEGLTNLDALPDETFLFGAMPLKILGGDGAPCRAFASVGPTSKELV